MRRPIPQDDDSGSASAHEASGWLVDEDDGSEELQYNVDEDHAVPSHDKPDLADQEDSPETSGLQAAPPTMSPRAYQLEMLEESLKQNIIVAMDTGSGKTQVAILRMRKELEMSGKLIWFLAPTVALADQQFKLVQTCIPGVQSRLLLGSDNVERWTGPQVWQAYLTNVRIVVSTVQILFDAVKHAMLDVGSLGLLVIDEAHNFARKHPGARLMKEYYWPAKNQGLPVPHILGLTASPAMRSTLLDIDTLERTLDAVCKTPHRHREELMKHVNRPSLFAMSYGKALLPPRASDYTASMKSLQAAYQALDFAKDPTIVRYQADRSARGQDRLRNALMKRDTYCQKQMKTFWGRSIEAYQNLGPWAADYYIHRVISEFLAQQNSNGGTEVSQAWEDGERHYLATAFRSVKCQQVTLDRIDSESLRLSPKVQKLLQVLHLFEGTPVGIVFVQERYAVAILSYLISVHPLTKARYRVAAVVGSSRVAGRRADFLDLSSHDDLCSLPQFQSGSRNLLVATSVLEEGIDVPACNLVVCFNKVHSPKVLIQRRGRARMQVSQLYLLIDEDSVESVTTLQELEQEMKQKYEDDMRELAVLEELEQSLPVDYPVLLVESTGACMTLDDAKQNLDRFCATLSSRRFVNSSPFYVTSTINGGPFSTLEPPMLRATVHLPASIALEYRKFESSRAWRSEKNACRDAAFQAYEALYRAGLVNDYLLPYKAEKPVSIEQRDGLALVSEQINPWPSVAQAWKSTRYLYRRQVRFTSHDGSISEVFAIVLPVPVPSMEDLTLYWDADSAWTLTVDDYMEEIPIPSSLTPETMPDHTPALLKLAYGHRIANEAGRRKLVEQRNTVCFLSSSTDLTMELTMPRPLDPASLTSLSQHLLRQPSNQNHPYIPMECLPAKPPMESVRHPYRGMEESPEDVPYIVVQNWPKKAGFFVPVKNSGPTTIKPYPRVLPATEVMVDNLPPVFSYFGMMIPSITYALGIHLVAADLMESRLSRLGLDNLSLVLAATSASQARWTDNYEKLEFLGDALLGFCTAVHCSAIYPYFPEGLLSQKKETIVSNLRLSRASVEFGLDRYILTAPLNLQKWAPNYVEDLLANPPQPKRREISTKTLADVVEALIGASLVSTLDTHPGGDLSRVVECIQLFLPTSKPEEKWRHPELERQMLNGYAPADEVLPTFFNPLEDILGYQFQKKSLLIEAMTHASDQRPNTRACLERLEFLGDSILGYIVTRVLYSARDTNGQLLLHSKMHLLRTALVNGEFLGFLILEWKSTQPRVDVVLSEHLDGHAERVEVQLEEGVQEMAVWQFLQHSSVEMGAIMQTTAERHEQRAELRAAIHHGKTYPWAALARLQAPKVLSDMFESILAAVWVDSGSLEACEQVLRRAGILWYMERMLRDEVHVLHPKEELGHVAGHEKVTYEDETRIAEDGKHEHVCRVAVGDHGYVAEVHGGVTKEEARTRAAAEAVRALRALGTAHG